MEIEFLYANNGISAIVSNPTWTCGTPIIKARIPIDNREVRMFLHRKLIHYIFSSLCRWYFSSV